MKEEKLAAILKAQYGIEGPPPELLREGGGQTYVVHGEEKYLLKVIGPAFMQTARQSVSIMQYLEEKGFPTPRIVLTGSGEAALETAGYGEEGLIVLMEFIEGEEPDLTKCAAEVGALTGRFHRLMETCPVEPVLHGKEFFIGRYLEFLRRKNDPNLAAYRALGEGLWERVRDLPQGKCHGDLHRGNLLQRPDGRIYLVDFDTVCRAPRMFDVTVLCDMTDYFRLKTEDVLVTRRVYEDFFSGYSKYCTLSRREVLSFPDWVAIRHFQLQATILELFGIDCIDGRFIEAQLAWLKQWQQAASVFGE